MEIEVLYFEGCPNSAEALRRTMAALVNLGRGDIKVAMREIRTMEDARGTPFAGSPTISVDGKDIFPGPIPAYDLTCRLYRTTSGLRGVPAFDQLKEALINVGL